MKEKHTKERARLAGRVLSFLRTSHDARPSFNAMAQHCDVSRTTLRHYFEDMEGAVAAALSHVGATTRAHEAMLDAPLGGVSVSLSSSLRLLVHIWTTLEVGALFHTGLLAGLGITPMGPVFLEHILDPTIDGFARRLERHIDSGELVPMDTRTAALSLVGPILLALLHQHQLGGAHSRPIDLDALVMFQVTAFLGTWAVRVEES